MFPVYFSHSKTFKQIFLVRQKNKSRKTGFLCKQNDNGDCLQTFYLANNINNNSLKSGYVKLQVQRFSKNFDVSEFHQAAKHQQQHQQLHQQQEQQPRVPQRRKSEPARRETASTPNQMSNVNAARGIYHQQQQQHRIRQMFCTQMFCQKNQQQPSRGDNSNWRI